MATQPRKGFARVNPEGLSLGQPGPVTVPSEPTLEQCENVAMVMGLPILPRGLQPAYYAESMRNLHALIVRMLNGDEEAARTVAALKAAFGREAENSHEVPQ